MHNSSVRPTWNTIAGWKEEENEEIKYSFPFLPAHIIQRPQHRPQKSFDDIQGSPPEERQSRQTGRQNEEALVKLSPKQERETQKQIPESKKWDKAWENLGGLILHYAKEEESRANDPKLMHTHTHTHTHTLSSKNISACCRFDRHFPPGKSHEYLSESMRQKPTAINPETLRDFRAEAYLSSFSLSSVF